MNLLGLRQGDDFLHEFSSVFKEFYPGQHGHQHDPQSLSVIKAHILNQLPYAQQQNEVLFFDKKAPVIPIRTKSENVKDSYSEMDPNADLNT